MDTRRLSDGLAALYLPIAAAVFVVFVLIVGVAVVRYRRRGDGLPSQKHETRWEYAYAVGLACVAAFLVAVSFHVENKIDGIATADPGVRTLRVHVTAAQWNWRFSYPDLGVTLPATPNPRLVVPTRTQVIFSGTSEDVIHAFYIPARRFKRQLYQGSTTTWDLTWPRPTHGEAGECSFYCGLEHSSMRFAVDAVPREQFDAWLRRQRGQATR